jgi:hypothetical protein
MRIHVDRWQAIEVYDRLVDQYLQKGFPYNQPGVFPPQSIVPENLPLNGREYALYLFCSCYYMSGGIESDTAFRSLARMYHAQPDVFDPAFVVENGLEPDDIASVLSRYGLNYGAEKNSRFWVENFKRLQEFWGGDPRNLLSDTRSYEELCENIRNKGTSKVDRRAGMLGFQHKMVSMIAYFLTDTGLVRLPYTYPIPVDFHVIRVNLEHRIVRVTGRSKKINRTNELLQTLRDLSVWYCNLKGIDSNILADALWLLSKNLCRHNPGNSFRVKENRRLGKNYRGRKRQVVRKHIAWTRAQIHTYHRTCGNCPVENTCKLQIPAAHYYVRGHVSQEGMRAVPHQLGDVSEWSNVPLC